MADLKKTLTVAAIAVATSAVACVWLFTGATPLGGDITQDGPMVSSSNPAYLESMKNNLDEINALIKEDQEIERQAEVGTLVSKIPLVPSNTKEGACIAGEARFMTPSEGLLLFVGAEEFEKDLQIHDYTKMNLTDAQARALDNRDVVIAYGKNDKSKLYDLGATQGKSWDERTKAMADKAESLKKEGICR